MQLVRSPSIVPSASQRPINGDGSFAEYAAALATHIAFEVQRVERLACHAIHDERLLPDAEAARERLGLMAEMLAFFRRAAARELDYRALVESRMVRVDQNSFITAPA